MANAFVPLANITLGSAANTVTFSSISGAYKDLRIVFNGGAATASNPFAFRINSDTGSNYAWVVAHGSGSGYASQSNGGDTYGRGENNYLDTNQCIVTMDFLDYSATTKHKSVLVRASYQALGVTMTANRWANTSAITTVTLSQYNNAANFAAGSTFALYGVKA